MSKRLPRPRGPGLFSVVDLGRDQLKRPIEYFDRLGDTFALSFFGTPLVSTRDPQVFEDVLVKKHKSFGKDELTRGLSLLLGQGLLTSDGERWKKNRRLLQPHFQPTELTSYLSCFREEAEREAGNFRLDAPVDLQKHMAGLTVRIALRAIFGVDGRDASDFEQSMQAVMEFFTGVLGTGLTLPLSFPSPANVGFKRARTHLLESIRGIVERGRAEGAPDSVLGSLLSEHESGAMSEAELVDECITLLLAGHETTALTLTFTLALLATHPEIQETLALDLASRPPPTSLDDVRAAGSLNRVVRESLRLFPVAWAVGREALEDVEIAGFHVSKGTQVYLYLWAAHRNPRFFEEPTEFRPERWTTEFEASLPKHLYQPFGGGPRVCIGQHFALAELVTILSVLLRTFRFEREGRFEPRLLPSVTTRPRDPVLVRVVPR